MSKLRALIPAPEDISLALSSFSIKQRLVWWALVFTFFLGIAGTLYDFNRSFLVEVPTQGGSLTEGIVGVPRFINPILAASDADRDLTALVYSGLMRVDKNGTLAPDLAEKYEVSEDGLTYTFTLKQNLTWHDRQPITSDDVVFTIQKAQDASLKSPRRASWEGVAVERVDDRTVQFRLKQPYALFLESATMGIIPKHIWKNLDSELFPLSQFNIEGIGSGPYRITSVTRDSSGIPLYYSLSPFEEFALGAPYIKNLRLTFYPNEEKLVEGYRTGEVDSIGSISPESVTQLGGRSQSIVTATLPRVFAVFFNQNQAKVFANKSVRHALDLALNKEGIVEQVLLGYGDVIAGPIPKSATSTSATSTVIDPARLEAARNLLTKDGWKQNVAGVWEKKTKKESSVLAFSLATADSPELRQATTLIADTWKALGANVELKIFEIGDLNQNIIRPRKYDALFFGEIVGRDPDLFSFWHSSQRNDPGLNIALYANVKADKLLDQARKTSDTAERESLIASIVKEISNDAPASFVYSPKFIYIIDPIIKGVSLTSIVTNSERFAHINKWYIDTDQVWKMFLQ